MLVEDVLANPHERLSKGAATYTFPSCEPIRTSDQRIQKEGRVLHEPCDHRMIHGDLLIDPLLEAELYRTEEASHESDSDFSATVRHRVVRNGVFFADLLQVLDLNFRQFDGSASQSLNRWLIVGFDDDSGMAKPFNDLQNLFHDDAVLVKTFARDDVSKYRLGHVASDNKALGKFTSLSSCIDILVAHLELTPKLDA